MFANNKTLRCTQCNAEFDTLDEGKCPECGSDDDYIVVNEIEGEDEDE
jgi:rRNA maturation endonuclease Nob1